MQQATLLNQPARPLLLKEGRHQFTPAQMERVLAECRFDRQRPLKTGNVQALADAMRRGLWTEGTQIHFARMNGLFLQLDGQHRFNAGVAAQKAIEFDVLISDCSSMDEVARLYYRHDTVSAPRNMVDMIRATGLDTEKGLSQRETGVALSALKFIAGGMKGENGRHSPAELRSPDARLAMASPWWPSIKSYMGAISVGEGHHQRRLMWAPIVAVGVFVFKHQPEKAVEFWGELARDDGLRKGDPRKTLTTWLQSASAGRRPHAGEMIRAAASAWNAFFEGRQLSLIKCLLHSPVSIAGTPIGTRKRKE